MEVKELMIDDWFHNNYTNENYQVWPMFLSQATNSGKRLDATFEDINITPIPLTKEILMNNGFRIIFESELHTTYFQDIESFHVEVKIDCINYIKLSMSNGLGYRVTIECKYVHLLQHAFRLCGITKEIVL